MTAKQNQEKDETMNKTPRILTALVPSIHPATDSPLKVSLGSIARLALWRGGLVRTNYGNFYVPPLAKRIRDWMRPRRIAWLSAEPPSAGLCHPFTGQRGTDHHSMPGWEKD